MHAIHSCREYPTLFLSSVTLALSLFYYQLLFFSYECLGYCVPLFMSVVPIYTPKSYLCNFPLLPLFFSSSLFAANIHPYCVMFATHVSWVFSYYLLTMFNRMPSHYPRPRPYPCLALYTPTKAPQPIPPQQSNPSHFG